MTDSQSYVGSELDLFRVATHWKSYFAAQISPFIRGDVLEVGAGLGGTTAVAHRSICESWTCLEPDADLASQLGRATQPLRDRRGRPPRVQAGTLSALAPQQLFDSILYIDVLEHIENDRAELVAASSRLLPGGHLIVLSPAWGWLYTPFDRAIGHYRRYSRHSLEACAPPELVRVRSRYLDSAGMAASLGNLLLARQSMPTPGQVRFWDGWLVPISRRLDRLLDFRVGKSILVVWQRPE